MDTLYQSDLSSYRLLKRGKVRDVYSTGNEELLMIIACDRISAFDCVLPTPIPNKGMLILIEELCTPDSSRFWPADDYEPGKSPISFDKQYVRDYLEYIRWDKNPPAPELPSEVARKTAEKYQEAYVRLTDTTIGLECF